jgi:hypothetical protein
MAVAADDCRRGAAVVAGLAEEGGIILPSLSMQDFLGNCMKNSLIIAALGMLPLVCAAQVHSHLPLGEFVRDDTKAEAPVWRIEQIANDQYRLVTLGDEKPPQKLHEFSAKERLALWKVAAILPEKSSVSASCLGNSKYAMCNLPSWPPTYLYHDGKDGLIQTRMLQKADEIEPFVVRSIPPQFIGEWCDKSDSPPMDIRKDYISFYDSGGPIKSVVSNGRYEIALTIWMGEGGVGWIDTMVIKLSPDEGKLGFRENSDPNVKFNLFRCKSKIYKK